MFASVAGFVGAYILWVVVKGCVFWRGTLGFGGFWRLLGECWPGWVMGAFLVLEGFFIWWLIYPTFGRGFWKSFVRVPTET